MMFDFQARLLATVPRWSIVPLVRKQSVAEHSFYVTLYAVQIAEFIGLGVEEQGHIARRALTHDMIETWTSDIPGPIKRQIVDRRAMPTLERDFNEKFASFREIPLDSKFVYLMDKIIKVADIADECYMLQLDAMMGNQIIFTILESCRKRFKKACDALQATLQQLGFVGLSASQLYDKVIEAIERIAEGVQIPQEGYDGELGS